MTLKFSGQIFKEYSVSYPMKIRPGGDELFNEDGRTDTDEDTNGQT